MPTLVNMPLGATKSVNMQKYLLILLAIGFNYLNQYMEGIYNNILNIWSFYNI